MMKTTVGMIAEYGAVFLGTGGNGPFSEVKYDNSEIRQAQSDFMVSQSICQKQIYWSSC